MLNIGLFEKIPAQVIQVKCQFPSAYETSTCEFRNSEPATTLILRAGFVHSTLPCVRNCGIHRTRHPQTTEKCLFSVLKYILVAAQ